MASKTFYLKNALASGSNHLSLQDGGSPPATATTGTGWTVGTLAPTRYALMDSQVVRSTASFGTTALPNAAPDNTLGDCWRSENTLNGIFGAGTWSFRFPVIAVTTGGYADGRVRVRVWKGSDPTGSGATELTASTLQGSVVTNLATGAEQVSVVTWTPGSNVVFEDEYLFVQMTWQITGVGFQFTDDVRFRVGATAYLTTPGFVEWTSHPYHYEGFLALLPPKPVFRALIDAQTLTDGKVSGTSIYQYLFVKSITLGDSSMATIEEGMTVTIGGSLDSDGYGRARVRGVYNYSGTNVIMVWASPNQHEGELYPNTDLYLTVWEDYRLWMKPPYAAGGNYYYDGDKGPQYVTYDNLPIANLGPAYAGFVDPATGLITVSFSAADSFAADYDSVLGGYSADRCTGGTASASSANGGNVAANAFDDNTGTYWESVGASNQWVAYEWTTYSKYLRKLSITASGTTAPKEFKIEVQLSHVGAVWRTVRHLKNETGWGASETRSFAFHAPRNANKVRVTVVSNNGGASIRIEEIAVFEEDRSAGSSPYLWDVKDGTIIAGSSTSESITATFPIGVRHVKLTVADNNGHAGVGRRPVVGVLESEQELDYAGATITDSSSYDASLLFDNDSTTIWRTTDLTTSGWVQIQFAAARSVGTYQVQIAASGYMPANCAPNAWTFQGSNDGSTWTVLDTRAYQVFASGELKSYTLQSPARYAYYKIDVASNNGGTYLAWSEFNLLAAYPAVQNFEVVSQELSVEGQSIEFRVYEDIPYFTYPGGPAVPRYPDNTLVLYWEREVYQDVVVNLPDAGPTGREHMKFVGWIDDEPTQIEAEEETLRRYITLRCIDVGGKLQKLPGFNAMAERVTQTAPTSTQLMDHANIDRFVYFILRWLSTAAEITDFIWSGTSELWQFPILSAEGGSIYDMADGRCQAAAMRLTCNKHGQLVMRYDQILLHLADRDLTLLATLESGDYRSIDYTQQRASRYHWLWGSAILTSYLGPNEAGGSPASPLFVVAPGEAPGQGLGLLEQGEQLVQDIDNLRAREAYRYSARLNAPQSNFRLVLAHGGDKGIDPASMRFVKIGIPAEVAAQRGLEIYTAADGSYFLPFRVTIEHDHNAMTKTVSLEVERSQIGLYAVQYSPP